QVGLGSLVRGMRVLGAADDALALVPDKQSDWLIAHLRKLPAEVFTALCELWGSISAADRGRIRQTAGRLSGGGSWRLRVDRLGHADLLQRALEESGAYVLYAAEAEGEMILANLARLFDLVREEEGQDSPGLACLARWLRDQVEESYKEDQ